MVSKTWFWAIIRAKNETNRICWPQNKNAPKFEGLWPSKCWLSSPSKIMRLIFSKLPKNSALIMQASQNKEIPTFWKNVEVLQITWLKRIWDLKSTSHKKTWAKEGFSTSYLLRNGKIAWKDFKLGTTFSKTHTKKFRISGKRDKFYRFWLERKEVFETILNKCWSWKGFSTSYLHWDEKVVAVYLKQSIGDNLIFCFTSKFKTLLKYAQNQRAKTIFVFFTKTYLLKHGNFL